jgi:hypothetical protein
LQAEALKFFVEWFGRACGAARASSGGTSRRLAAVLDAVVDYYGAKKLAFECLRRCQQPLH